MEITNDMLYRALSYLGGGRGVSRNQFKSYIDRVREGVNAAAIAFDISEQRDRMGNMVQQGECAPGRDGRERDQNGKRCADGRHGDELRPVDNEQCGEAALARWKDCENYECPYREYSLVCLDRQRAGTCPALAGRGG